MTNSTWAGGVDEKDSPLRAARACGEGFVAVDDVTAVDFFNCGAEADGFVGFASLGFAAPCNPFFTAFDDAFEPARLLLFGGHTVEQDERVDVAFPAAGEGEIG